MMHHTEQQTEYFLQRINNAWTTLIPVLELNIFFTTRYINKYVIAASLLPKESTTGSYPDQVRYNYSHFIWFAESNLLQVKTFDKMLKKADDSSCSLRSLPDESIETFRPVFSSALKKLEESLEPEASKKSKSGDKIPKSSKRKRTIQT